MNLHLNSHLWLVATLLDSPDLQQEVTSLLGLAGQDIGFKRPNAKDHTKSFLVLYLV